MSNQRRQEIYNKIKESSKEEFILQEMRKMGFWSEDKETPSVTAELIEKEALLTKELRELWATQKKFENKEKLLKEIHQKRMTASKVKQKENKERKKKEREAKALAWKEKQAKEISYLGEEVSHGLRNTESQKEKLAQLGLPHFENEQALATAMGITLGKLRFLAYNRKVSKVSHYKQFYLPKKTGGKRLISAPMPDLKMAQTSLLHTILYKIPLHEAVHGFTPNKSIVSNATPHLGQDIVINLDLKDFFPNISYKRVKGLFHSFGYSERISTILACLCTEAPTQPLELDGQSYFVQTGERHLPQGSPASPAITNLICRKMDARLQGLANKYHFTYTRYADDMTFSAKQEHSEMIPKLLANVRRIVKDESFILHPDKLRIMKKGSRKEVTGIVVNEKLNISRKTLDNFRALLFQIEKDGIEGKTWNGSSNLLGSIYGYANYISMVNPEKGKLLLPRVKAILKQHNFKHTIVFANKSKQDSKGKKQSSKKGKAWWQFWKK